MKDVFKSHEVSEVGVPLRGHVHAALPLKFADPLTGFDQGLVG